MLNYSTERRYGTVGIAPILKDIDNTKFTDYVPAHLDDLVRYAKKLEGIDPEKAEDLVHDVWYSYKVNEEDGKCFSYSGGHGNFISVEEAVKARMKKMLHKKSVKDDEYIYMASTKGSSQQYTSFMEPDSEEDDDNLQKALRIKAQTACTMLDEIDEDLKDSMFHFIACTVDCKIPGINLLDNLDAIVDMITGSASGSLGKASSDMMFDIWKKGQSIREDLTLILKEYCNDRDGYFQTLRQVREEYKSCQRLIKDHNLSVKMDKQKCRQMLADFTHTQR